MPYRGHVENGVIGGVPEAPTAKPFGVEAQQVGQDRALSPGSHTLFAGGMLQAVDDGQHEIEPARDAIALAWDMGLEQVNQADLDGCLVHGGDEAEFAMAYGYGSPGRLQAFDDGLGASQVDGIAADPAFPRAFCFSFVGGVYLLAPASLRVVVDLAANFSWIDAHRHVGALLIVTTVCSI